MNALGACGLALLALLATACDVGARVPESGAWNIEVTPEDGASHVARLAALRIELDRRILPRSIGDAITLRSGELSPALELRYELLEREVHVRFPEWAPLHAATSYRLEIDGLIDLDGEAQPEPVTVHFRTGVELGEPPPAAEPVDVGEVLGLFAARCVEGRCHGGAEPAAGLDLSSARGIAATAPRQSSQLELGTLGMQGAAGVLWLPATRIIDLDAGRGDPASSYLMYKLLGDPHVVGDAMPPTGARLSAQALELVARWIRAGAPTVP